MADFFEIDFLGVETSKSGDAIAIRYELAGQTTIHVVDGGYTTSGERLRDLINKYYDNPAFIDRVVATHNDGDHARGLVAVLEHFEIGELWMLRPWEHAEELIEHFDTYESVPHLQGALRRAYTNLAALEDIAIDKGIPIYEPFQGAQIGAFHVMAPSRERYLDLILTSNKTPESSGMESRIDSILGTIVEKAKTVVALLRASWGAEAFPPGDTSNENEMSVVQYATLNGKKILLTADTGRNGLQEVIDHAPYVGLTLPGIDRFQVPHHGGRHNVNADLLNAIVGPILQEPQETGHFQAYISSAKADEDHPRKVVQRALIHRGANLHMTEGQNIRTSGGAAPSRPDYTPLVPTAYPDSYEEA
ncbi:MULTISPECIES: MBL fold metallo-hydrolase [Acetobacter]|uniref:MBL fold metallo-hydrolase n=1 Tax=Acetobacter conturbans TaxID=1737472 RepID=A0ABX0K5C8_9PROT|nr:MULTISPECIES: MBL fold metallo-hydrolase [Acetobacter]NHN89815.1 MBL fold metallo-hydrolase [Acetobacter conturbans]NHN93077.1 MBL fold metallo-hydrolase [Acetobacter sicerae]